MKPKPKLLALPPIGGFKFKCDYGDVHIIWRDDDTTAERALWLLEAAKLELLFGGGR